MSNDQLNRFALSVALGILAGIAGCGDAARGIASVDPEAVTAKAMQEWDRNGDRAISGDEFEAAVSLRAGIAAYDTDHDGAISHDELRRRIETMQDLPRGNTIFTCYVSYQGRPLAGANVRLVPESFLVPAIAPATGVTDETGQCFVLIEAEDWSQQERLNFGLDCGAYRVTITHPEIAIPARYNTESKLGVDVALDTGRMGESASFDLQSR